MSAAEAAASTSLLREQTMRMVRFVSERSASAVSRPMLIAALLAGTVAGIAPMAAAAQSSSAQASAAAPAAAAAAAPTNTTPANGVGSAFELTFWQSLAGSDDSAAYDAYLAKYPDGTFSGLARARIAAIQRALAVQPAVATAPGPVAAPIPAAAPTLKVAPKLAPTPAVLIAAVPAAEPVPAATQPEAGAMIPASASLATADPASPLAKLLLQLRGTPETGAASAATAPPMVTAAPPVHPVYGATPAIAPVTEAAVAAAPPASQQQAYAPAPTAVPAAAPAQAAPQPVAASYASARPILLPVPGVTMPAYFCSNDARNDFHNGYYRPAVEAATRNNEAAVGYLRQLQQTYDRGQLGRDTAVLNAIAAEARAYQAEAASAYTTQAALVHQFDVLMAIPLRPCASGTQ